MKRLPLGVRGGKCCREKDVDKRSPIGRGRADIDGSTYK